MKVIKYFFVLNLTFFLFAGFGELSLDTLKSGGALSVISQGNSNILNMSLLKDFSLADFTLGLGVNIVVPENKRPSGLNLLEFRYAGYDNKQFGVKYGLLSNISLGYGLLMDGYNSAPNATYFDQSKAGLMANVKFLKPFSAYGLMTGSKIYGIRFTYDTVTLPVINKPLAVGTTYIKDGDGVASGNQTINNEAYAYGLDLGVNIIESLLDMYIEQGNLSNGSHGVATGFRLQLLQDLVMRAEYRIFGINFMPNLFNSSYEISPTNLNAYRQDEITGYFAGFEYSLFSLGKVSVGYENYQNKFTNLKAAALFNNIMGYQGVMSYENNLLSTAPYIIRGTLIYPINLFSSAVINMERIGEKEPNYSVSYKLNF